MQTTTSKRAKLEAEGIFVPFVTKPKRLKGQHVLLEVDKTAAKEVQPQ
jgi:hypothetical protein